MQTRLTLAMFFAVVAMLAMQVVMAAESSADVAVANDVQVKELHKDWDDCKKKKHKHKKHHKHKDEEDEDEDDDEDKHGSSGGDSSDSGKDHSGSGTDDNGSSTLPDDSSSGSSMPGTGEPTVVYPPPASTVTVTYTEYVSSSSSLPESSNTAEATATATATPNGANSYAPVNSMAALLLTGLAFMQWY
ncbi:hypothetical protein BC940DRAFT_301968 [Gongronella butleri]|nr:hypothetical protein BC940DRAFT_301968 [Gongronella butleri]